MSDERSTVEGYVPTANQKSAMRGLVLTQTSIFFVQFVVPLFAHRFGASATAVGVSMAALTAGNGVGSLLSGSFANVRSHIPALLTGACIAKTLCLLGVYYSLVAGELVALIPSMFALGASSSAAMVPLETALADQTELGHRAEMFGHMAFYVGVSSAIGSSVGLSVLGTAQGFEAGVAVELASLCFMALFNTLGAAYFARSASRLVGDHASIVASSAEEARSSDNEEHSQEIPPRPKEERAEERAVAALSAGWPLTIFLVAIGVEAIIASLSNTFVTILLKEVTNASENFIALAYTPGGLLAIAMGPLLGRLADTFRARNILALGSIVGGAATALLLLVTRLWQAAIVLVCDFSVMSLVGVTLGRLVSSVSTVSRGSVMGRFSAARSLGSIIGPVVGGVLWDNVSHATPFITSAACEGLIAGVYVVVLTWKPIDMLRKDGT